MSVSVTMPQLGESVTEGTVTRWLKQEGEQVQADEPLLEVSTDKVDTEIPSPASGTLASIAVGEDETVEVGAELATIDDGSGGGDSGGADEQEPAADEQPAREQQDQQQAQGEEQQQEPTEQERDSAQAGTQRKPAEDETAQEQAEPEQPPQQQQQPQQEPPEQKQPTAEPVPTPPSQQQQPSTAVAPQPESSGADQGGEDAESGAYVTPLVRKLAAEHNVDLAALDGTGVGGRIRKQDVLDAARAAAQPAATAQEKSPEPAAAAAGRTDAQQPSMPAQDASAVRGRTEKMSRLRSVIAQRMVESLQTSAQLTTVVEVDVTKIARLRQRAKADFERREGTKLSFLPFFAVATIEALKAHPNVNASVDTDAGTVTYHDAEHLGIAVDTERGLLVPVIKDAGDLNIGGLARKIADLAERTRTNKITPDELGGGTFTLTNTGSRGALFDTPIINQPQVGILGTGSVVKRAVVVDDDDLGEIVTVRSMAYLALTYDHRIVDGADAARFLGTVKERLQTGDFDAQLGL